MTEFVGSNPQKIIALVGPIGERFSFIKVHSMSIKKKACARTLPGPSNPDSHTLLDPPGCYLSPKLSKEISNYKGRNLTVHTQYGLEMEKLFESSAVRIIEDEVTVKVYDHPCNHHSSQTTTFPEN